MVSLRRFILAVSLCLFSSSSLFASRLGYEEQWALARRFAPTFVFHPAEIFFPVSPLFPLEPHGSLAPEEALGSVAVRTSVYESLSLSEKLGLAKIYFQAYPYREGKKERVVVEYWLYYVRNEYEAKAGLIPVRFDTTHPNDMEHLFLILKRDPETAEYRIEKILASAHSDKVPDNLYVFPAGREADATPPVLVELGSHALAADVNRDGRFTPGIDSTGPPKFVWGIRDRGKSWARFDASYCEPRGSDAVEISPTDFRLEHVEALSSEFAALGLTGEQVRRVFQGRVSRLERVFGRSNGGPDRLILPSRHEDFRNPKRMAESYARDDLGVTLGYSVILADNTFFIGGRKRFVTNSSLLPDVVLDAHALLTDRGDDFYDAELLGYYPVDAMTRFFVGGAVITDSLEFDRRQFDAMAGVEFDLGPFKFRNAIRTTGPVCKAWFDFRLYFFPW